MSWENSGESGGGRFGGTDDDEVWETPAQSFYILLVFSTQPCLNDRTQAAIEAQGDLLLSVDFQVTNATSAAW
jgi:hypothetical protein